MAETVIMVLPTFNEAGAIAELMERIYAQPFAEQGYSPGIVVVDDNSPDGTAQEVRNFGLRYPGVHLTVNPVRRGRGSSGSQGLAEALRLEADYIIEMDADGSHPPEYILPLLRALESADVVIGSRYLESGCNLRRSRMRNAVSRLARGYINLCLGSALSDPASGYRGYTRSALERIQPQRLTARDPFIVTEILARALDRKLRLKEIPITFQERHSGRSKLKLTMLLAYLWRAAALRFKLKRS